MPFERDVIVAVDGPAGSGKSSVAKALAEALSLRHVDTGAMYRALALKAILEGVDVESAKEVGGLLPGTTIELDGERVTLDGVDVSSRIRDEEVSSASSKVAQHQEVRRWMVERQRQIVNGGPGGAVVEGRDIGTVVLPHADLKLYLTASERERASRRSRQAGISEQRALDDVRTRDARDTERTVSPLRVADDAVVLDTTSLSLPQVVEKILSIVQERGS
ncbi:MAG: (d)CMP kinase [Actinomycetota bacterium]|nr:(d)CMP kinase [Actinomycetota bacterium]